MSTQQNTDVSLERLPKDVTVLLLITKAKEVLLLTKVGGNSLADLLNNHKKSNSFAKDWFEENDQYLDSVGTTVIKLKDCLNLKYLLGAFDFLTAHEFELLKKQLAKDSDSITTETTYQLILQY